MTDATWSAAIALNDELARTFETGVAAWDRLVGKTWSTYRTCARTVAMGLWSVVWSAVLAVQAGHWLATVMLGLVTLATLAAIGDAVRALGRVVEARQWRARCAAEQAEAAERANLCRAWSRVLAEA